MKAVRYHGPRDCRYEDVPDPQPGPDDVLVKVAAAGICATDIEVYDGVMFYFTSGMSRVPVIIGHEWSGTVVDCGQDVTGFQVGDLVTGECSIGCGQCDYCKRGWYNQCPNRTETGLLNRDGGFAEYIVMPRLNTYRCNGMTPDAAATIEPTGVALYPTKVAAVCPADIVAVIGDGAIGLYMVQTAKAYGARQVLLIGSRPERLAVGRELGASDTLEYRDPGIVEKVREQTAGHGVDVVLEGVGKPSVWPIIAGIIAPHGRIMMTGLFAGQTCGVLFDPLVVNDITLRGTVGGPNCWEECIDLHERGAVTAEPIITHHLPLSDFDEAIEIARLRKGGAIKVMLPP